jgi:hypothetical protein
MTYWNAKQPSTSHLRLFDPKAGWRAYEDVQDAEQRTTAFGSGRTIELALNGALSASNLLVLTGAGSSFCATNATGPRAPTMADLWDAVETAVTAPELSTIIRLIPAATNLNKNIEKLLTLSKLYVALFTDANSARVANFIAEAEKAIVDRAAFVGDTTNLDSHRNFVRKIARRGIRKPRAKVFTTNYDLCFEQAARGQQFVTIDGFSHSIPQVYDRAHFTYDVVRRESDSDAPNYIENVFHLYKLHGSIDWRRKGQDLIRSRNASDGTPVLIYPRDSKYQEAFEPPFLDLMGAFQTAIREPDTALVISGFGFNDDHICKPVIAAIEANMSLKIIICDVAFIDDAALDSNDHVIASDAHMRTAGNEYFARFKSLVVAGDERIQIINGRFEDLSIALPDLVAATERERHAERLRATRGEDQRHV